MRLTNGRTLGDIRPCWSLAKSYGASCNTADRSLPAGYSDCWKHIEIRKWVLGGNGLKEGRWTERVGMTLSLRLSLEMSLSYFSHPQIFSTHAILGASMETFVGNTWLGIGRKSGFISSSHLLSLHFFNKGVAKDYIPRDSSSLSFKWEGDSAHIATRRLNSSLAVNYLAFLHPYMVRLLRCSRNSSRPELQK